MNDADITPGMTVRGAKSGAIYEVVSKAKDGWDCRVLVPSGGSRGKGSHLTVPAYNLEPTSYSKQDEQDGLL